MNFAAQLVAWLNVAANALGKLLLAPIALLPGWLSITVVSAFLGLACLIVFKYTSRQRAVQRVRDDIQAHLLILRLFPDSLWVTLRAEGRLLRGAAALLLLAVVPMLVMIVPVSLLLGQLGLWYQVRPLRIGEEAVVTLQLRGDAGAALPDVRLDPTSAVETVLGPLQVLSKREICWNLRAREKGCHRLVFHCDGEIVEQATGHRRRLHAHQCRAAGVVLVRHSLAPGRSAVSSRLARARDSHRLSRPPVLDQRQRLLARVLLRGLDVFRLLFPPLAQGGDVISQLFT